MAAAKPTFDRRQNVRDATRLGLIIGPSCYLFFAAGAVVTWDNPSGHWTTGLLLLPLAAAIGGLVGFPVGAVVGLFTRPRSIARSLIGPLSFLAPMLIGMIISIGNGTGHTWRELWSPESWRAYGMALVFGGVPGLAVHYIQLRSEKPHAEPP